jgi:hypothetical protein
MPHLVLNHASAVNKYLEITGCNSVFFRDVLKLLLEERRMVHRERINERKHVCIVTARMQLKSQASAGRVIELMYKPKRPFIMKDVLYNGRYMLQRWNSPESVTLKFLGLELSLPPPCIQPCDPLDTPYLRYLNQSHGLLVNPLHNALDVKLLNEQWFDRSSPPQLFSL